jgi:hypothetical protein
MTSDYRQATEAELAEDRRRIDAARALAEAEKEIGLSGSQENRSSTMTTTAVCWAD